MKNRPCIACFLSLSRMDNAQNASWTKHHQQVSAQFLNGTSAHNRPFQCQQQEITIKSHSIINSSSNYSCSNRSFYKLSLRKCLSVLLLHSRHVKMAFFTPPPRNTTIIHDGDCVSNTTKTLAHSKTLISKIHQFLLNKGGTKVCDMLKSNQQLQKVAVCFTISTSSI